MRLAYLSADRIELQFATKELSKSDGGTSNGRCGSTEEMHPFPLEVSTMHPEL